MQNSRLHKNNFKEKKCFFAGRRGRKKSETKIRKHPETVILIERKRASARGGCFSGGIGTIERERVCPGGEEEELQ